MSAHKVADIGFMRPDLPARQANLSAALIIGLLALAAGGKIVMYGTLDPDCFWHLRVAEQLRACGVGPIVDNISFASIRQPWTPYSWLAELGMKRLWDLGGYRAAILCQALMAAGIVVFIALTCCIAAPTRLSAILATAVATFMCMAFLSFRPVTFALLLLSICVWLIVRDRAKLDERSSAVWLIVPITVLLTNVHLYSIFVPASVFVLLIGAVREKYKARHELDLIDGRRRVRRYAMLLILSLVACASTPMLQGALHTMSHYQFGDEMVASGIITEMRPFWHGWGGKITVGLVALLFVCAIVNRSALRPSEWLWLAGAALVLLRLGRFTPVFAIVAAPMLAATLPRLSDRVLQSRVVAAMMAMLLGFGIYRHIEAFPARDVPLSTWLNRNGPDVPNYPCAAADFVEKSVTPVHGALINEFTWGGYLGWRLGDTYKVLLDGRTQLYTNDFWRKTYIGGGDVRAAYLATVPADVAIVPRVKSRFLPTLQRLGWDTIYEDEFALVLAPPPSPTTTNPVGSGE